MIEHAVALVFVLLLTVFLGVFLSEYRRDRLRIKYDGVLDVIFWSGICDCVFLAGRIGWDVFKDYNKPTTITEPKEG